MFIRKLFVFSMFFSISMSSQAECEKWGCIGKITDIYTNADGVIYIGSEYDEKKLIASLFLMFILRLILSRKMRKKFIPLFCLLIFQTKKYS